MKRILQCTFLLSASAFILVSFNTLISSGIKGSVTPAENVEVIWAINGADSLKTVPANGAFTFDAKPGTYKVIVQAKEPFKDFVKENVTVKDDETTDLGVITLEK